MEASCVQMLGKATPAWSRAGSPRIEADEGIRDCESAAATRDENVDSTRSKSNLRAQGCHSWAVIAGGLFKREPHAEAPRSASRSSAALLRAMARERLRVGSRLTPECG